MDNLLLQMQQKVVHTGSNQAYMISLMVGVLRRGMKNNGVASK